MLQTLDPHSSFMDPAPTRRCASGRKAATTASASRSSRHRRRHHRRCGVRRLAGVQARHPPRRRDRAIEGEDAKGWTSEQAVNNLKGPKGTFVNIGSCAARLRRSDPDGRDARRDHHPDRPRSFMIDKETGYVRINDFAEHTDEELGRALETADGEGHEAPRARPARQPGRSARSGDPHGPTVPAAGLDDRLHARPREEFRSGLPRDRRRRVTNIR